MPYGTVQTLTYIPCRLICYPSHIIFRHSRSCSCFILGGRIDHGHHAGKAVRALNDAIAMAKACGKAVTMTDRGN